MNSLYDFINSQYQVWDPCIFSDTAAIDVTEIWTNPTSQSRVTRQRQVSTSDVDAWLKQTSTTVGGTKSSIVLRLVWVKFEHKERIKHISPAVLDTLLSHFRIEVAHKWNWTCFAGSTRFDGAGPAVQLLGLQSPQSCSRVVAQPRHWYNPGNILCGNKSSSRAAGSFALLVRDCKPPNAPCASVWY
jgi:hypothetical protein